ncbi:MAG: PDZ domain-containing protein, partial [Acidobacteria bacterium]|nr:PDZ domain-containing protein [Acidobacteriota bacterium]
LLKADIPDLPRIESAPEPVQPPGSFWAVCYPVTREDDLVRYLPVSFHRGRLNATAQAGAYYVSFENLLLTDHAIDDGCSGGPLIDSRGRLVGMILGSPQDGITYSSPVEEIQPIAELLSRDESPARPYFGIGLVQPDERRRARFSLAPGMTQPLIAYVLTGSPAERAGLRAGDILLSISGIEVATVREAGNRLLATPQDDPGLSMRIARNGVEQEMTVRPVSRPRRVLLEPIDEIQESLEVNLEEVPRRRGSPGGLRIADLVRGGRGEEARFANGDIIVTVNKKSVRTFQAFNDLIRKKFQKVFAEGSKRDRLYSSSYFLVLGVRTAEQKKVTRQYVNLFPDFLAPPVY